MGFLASAPWSDPFPIGSSQAPATPGLFRPRTSLGECADRGVRYQDLIARVGLGDGRQITARLPGIGLS